MPTPLEVAKSSIVAPIIFSVFVTTDTALLQTKLCACWVWALTQCMFSSIKDSSCRLPNCGPGSNRSFWLQVSPRRPKHSSSRRKWPCRFQRLVNFHPSTCSPQCNSCVRNKWAFQIDPQSQRGSKQFWFTRSQRRRNNHKPCNYSCRRPQCMALQRQRRINQWNQIPNKSQRHRSHIFLQGTFSAMHQRSSRNISCIRQQFSYTINLPMPFRLRTRKQRNQTGCAAKRLRELSTKKKPRRTEPRRSTLQLSTWSDVHKQKAQQTNQ